mgnify:CR=1 FL=1
MQSKTDCGNPNSGCISICFPKILKAFDFFICRTIQDIFLENCAEQLPIIPVSLYFCEVFKRGDDAFLGQFDERIFSCNVKNPF